MPCVRPGVSNCGVCVCVCMCTVCMCVILEVLGKIKGGKAAGKNGVLPEMSKCCGVIC